MPKKLYIGELARRLGISAKALRHYEAIGLLGEAPRLDSGYRVYGEEEEERLRFILGAKGLGLSLQSIKEIMALWSGGEQPCAHVSRLLEEKLQDLDRRIAELTRFRDELRAYKQRVDAGGASEAPCAHVEGVASGAWVPPGLETPAPLKPRS